MNSKTLFDQAMSAFSSGRIELGKELLKQSADLKFPIAVLYYAEHLFREDKSKGLAYLYSFKDQEVEGTLHRYVVLKVFFTDERLSVSDVSLLHKEALAGHVESTLILLNLTYEHKGSMIYREQLKLIAPILFKQLDIHIDKSATEEKCDLNNLFNFALNQWSKKFLLKPTVTLASTNMAIYQNVMTPLACKYFIVRLTPHLQVSLVHDPISGKAVKSEVRNSSIVNVEPDLLDWFTLELELLIETISGDLRCRGESLNFISYEVGQEYKPHYDAIVGEGQAAIADGGQRKRTAICYLNDNFAGGETTFPKLGLSVTPAQGSLLVFDNIHNSDKVLVESYHAGKPVLEGQKLIMTKWIRCENTQYGSIVYP